MKTLRYFRRVVWLAVALVGTSFFVGRVSSAPPATQPAAAPQGETKRLDVTSSPQEILRLRYARQSRENENEIRKLIRAAQFEAARQKIAASRQLLEESRPDLPANEPYAVQRRHLEELAIFLDHEQAEAEQENAGRQRAEAISRERQRWAEFHENRRPRTDKPYEQALLPAAPAHTPDVVGEADKIVSYPNQEKWRQIAQRDPLGLKSAPVSSETIAARKEKGIITRLAQVITKAKFPEGTTFEEMLSFIKERGGVDVNVHWKVLEDYDITKDAELTAAIELTDVTLETLLNIVLKTISPTEAEGWLDWDFPAGIIVISTRNDLHNRSASGYASRLKVYDVADLLLDVPGRPGGGFGPGGMGMGMMGGYGMGGGGMGPGGMGMGMGMGGAGYGGMGMGGMNFGGSGLGVNRPGGRSR